MRGRSTTLDNSSPAEMQRLCAELSLPEFLKAHPVIQATYGHYSLVLIHPFADGNGRVARLLASVFLCRSASIPLLVLADQKDRYLDALQAADAGNGQALVDFFTACSEEAFALIHSSLAAAAAPPVEESITRLRSAYVARLGATHEEVHGALSGFVKEVGRIVKERLDLLRQESEFLQTATVDEIGGTFFAVARPGTGGPTGVGGVVLQLTTKPPTALMFDGRIQLEVPFDPAAEDRALLRWMQVSPESPAETLLDCRIGDLVPSLRPSVLIHFDVALEGVVRRVIEYLATGAVGIRKKLDGGR